MDNQLISVIMPCYNAQAFVEQAVQSVLEQQHVSVELIVVDDGSDDDSPRILESLAEKYPQQIKFFTQENQGPYPARNLGLKQAKGNYIAFLDADDYWEDRLFKQSIERPRRISELILHIAAGRISAVKKGTEPYIPPVYEEGDISEAFLSNCPWPIHAALTRRAVLDRVGGFSERYFTSMDYDLWLTNIRSHT